MAPDSPTSTLSATEQSLKPVVIAACVAAGLATVALLAWAYAGAPRAAWWVCAAIGTAGLASNVTFYLAHNGRTTVGMVPVAACAMTPSVVLATLSTSTPSPVRLFSLSISFVLVALVILFAWWFARLRLSYHAHPRIARNAVLIVLGGAVKGGRPSMTLTSRLDVAADLWHESHRRTILVTGAITPDFSTTEADAMARYLIERGVAEKSIIRERYARNTRENIALSIRLLGKDRRSRQLCVVSSDYHLFRAMRDARKLGYVLTPIPAKTPMRTLPQQWSREVLTILAGR